MLTALSILIAWVSYKLPLPQPFSVTIASHVPTIIAMFISPWVALLTVFGSTIGFLISLGPIVALRAASHALFTLCGAYWLKKRANPYLVLAVAAVLHGLGEMVMVLLFGPMLGFQFAALSADGFRFIPGISSDIADYLINTVFIITVLHHIADCVIAAPVLVGLRRAGLIDGAAERLTPSSKK